MKRISLAILTLGLGVATALGQSNSSSASYKLSKIIPGTRYRIERTVDLTRTNPWSEFTNFTTLSEIFDHQLNDPSATGARWFYRVGVEPE